MTLGNWSRSPSRGKNKHCATTSNSPAIYSIIMGRTKKQKAAAAKDEPGPDDYIFLAVFFPVGRSGAALTRDEDPADIEAAQRIGRWMHEAGLPIRKLFSRKSEQHIIVEVRKTVPEDVINSKLGAYKWVDTIVDTSKIPPQFRDCETTILRARVRSHDAIDKLGGMVYFSVDPIIPNGPRSESQFRNPFPRPKRVGYAEPSTFSMIRYHPLPPEFMVVEDDDTQPDVKPDVKPDIKPSVNVEATPDVSREATQAPNSTQVETKPKPEADVKPKIEDLRPNIEMNPSAEERRAREAEAKLEEGESTIIPSRTQTGLTSESPDIRPNVEMNPSAEERIEQERLRPKHEEQDIRPNREMNPSAEERREQERHRIKYEEQDQQVHPSEPGPSTQQNGTTTGPTDTQGREQEIPPRVKAEPQQAPVIQKRPAEDSARHDRDIKRERLA
ncbi:unnamed protein product [Rhizoctonia solani]|uniref:Uncharacterized protein n=1 Tax=Rhizoctonia solani TaxID=456999 RepID=A0A8H3DLD4_9AGAM|nr:unnamed protein product [Rhizoctonia solani]